jgi:hypothetical protein
LIPAIPSANTLPMAGRARKGPAPDYFWRFLPMNSMMLM